MGFFEKIKSAIKKIKNKLIVFAILVVVIIILLIIPLTIAQVDAHLTTGRTFAESPMDANWWGTFLNVLFERIVTVPTKQLFTCFKPEYFGAFAKNVEITLVCFSLFAIIGIVKAIPKHEYQDIENGSSDWCEGGEQYKVLSKNKGLVLAEKNYLPLDKRGNVNILVVRRFWCW